MVNGLPAPLPKLLEGSPMLAAEDVKTFDWWAPDEAPSSARLSAFGRAFVQHLDDMSASEAALIAGLIEEAMTTGDVDAGTLAATGFLESAVTEAHTRSVHASVLQVLGPQSQEYYRSWAGL